MKNDHGILKQIREILNRDGLRDAVDVLIEIDQIVPGTRVSTKADLKK